mmetsp:Transcript_87375/g.178568  ORF Transcript_87375/g.178568 Transcript_87375/m.178568 type:complete len:201 (+) Transcript_87375:70-672(+)
MGLQQALAMSFTIIARCMENISSTLKPKTFFSGMMLTLSTGARWQIPPQHKGPTLLYWITISLRSVKVTKLAGRLRLRAPRRCGQHARKTSSSKRQGPHNGFSPGAMTKPHSSARVALNRTMPSSSFCTCSATASAGMPSSKSASTAASPLLSPQRAPASSLASSNISRSSDAERCSATSLSSKSSATEAQSSYSTDDTD